jgi:hypothetical protein
MSMWWHATSVGSIFTWVDVLCWFTKSTLHQIGQELIWVESTLTDDGERANEKSSLHGDIFIMAP